MKDKKIMICDDDQGILDVLQMMLEIEGYTVFVESNSTNLMSEMKIFEPDLLLMDLWMPVLSGDQILKTIRTSDEFSILPVIILSASVEEVKLQTLLALPPSFLNHLILTKLLKKLRT